MKIVILAQGHSPSVTAIAAALREKGQQVEILYYADADKNPVLHPADINPAGYDGALLWSWGTASHGRALLRRFEEAGVCVLNPTAATQISDSKTSLTNCFNKASLSLPRTLVFANGMEADFDVKVTRAFNGGPYVWKSDYGTGGKGVHFARSMDELVAHIAASGHATSPFIVQEFIGDPAKSISHYRVLVIGDYVHHDVICLRAQAPLTPSNAAAGGVAESVRLDPAMESLALRAARAAGLNVAGVDIMRHADGRLVVLEANDGPGLKYYVDKGQDVGARIAALLMQKISVHREKAAPEDPDHSPAGQPQGLQGPA